MKSNKRLYTYVLRADDGAAPNPYWGVCTLAICKPRIRSTARIGDWIIGTGSKNSQIAKKEYHDLSTYVVYAMKITDRMSLEEYNEYCKKDRDLKGKIPDRNSSNFEDRMGDCIYYDFINQDEAQMRESVHSDNKEFHTKRDLSGRNVLLSTHFYYFGLAAKELPISLRSIIKKNRGHKIIHSENIIQEFEQWISQFKFNKRYAEPQLSWQQSDDKLNCGTSCFPVTSKKKVC